MTTITPSVMNENNINTFTISDSNNGSNFYYNFIQPSGATNNFGTIISTNGLNKTFTFQSNTITTLNVTQTISYTLYDDYPYLSSTPTNNTIDFTINNVESLPTPYIKLVNKSNNAIVYVDENGNVDNSPEQNIILEAKIDHITDADIINNNGQIPTNGIYKWYKSDNNLTTLDGTIISGETNNYYTLTQPDVSKYIYVTYTYSDVQDHYNIATSGKTRYIDNINDNPTGDFYINEIYQTSTKDYTKFIVGAELTTVNTIKDDDVDFGTDFVKLSNVQKKYVWLSGTVDQSKNTYNYTIINNDVGNQMEVKYVYTDTFSNETTVAGLLNDNVSTINKTPTIINNISTVVTIDINYTHIISAVAIIDTDGSSLSLSFETAPVWLSLNTLTLTGTPNLEKYVGPNNVKINFKDNNNILRYTYEFNIIVTPKDTAPVYASISGDTVNTVNGLKTIENIISNIPTVPAIPTFGPMQTSKQFINQMIITDNSIIYNNGIYESNKVLLSISDMPAWLTISLNEADTTAENTGFTLSKDSSDIYYFSTTTIPNNYNYNTWIFDISGNIPDNEVKTHSIITNITDNYTDNTNDATFTYNIESQLFRYFLPDITTKPIQGSYFEKYIFVTSTTGQNNISMFVKKKPSWMKIMLISTLNDEDIPTGIILMESINESSPSVCDPPGNFNIALEIRDGTGLVIEFSNGTISTERQIGGYSSNDFSWMVLESPDQQRIVPRATAYPCFVCGDVNCSDNTFTKSQLDMRRKTETLAYKDKTFGFTKAQIISQMSRAKQGKKKQWAAQSITNSYPNVNNYTISGNMLTCPNVGTGQPIQTLASQSDVPGNKSFALYMEQNVPVVGYIPVRRTYATSGEKYPQHAYKIGDLGFPVGKSGKTPINDAFLIIRFSISGITQNMSTKFTSIENMFKLLFLGQRLSIDLSIDPIVKTTSTSEFFSITDNPPNDSGYIFNIKLLNRSLTDFKTLIQTLFINQIITIFNKFNFINSDNDFRNMCMKIISIDGSTNSSFVISLNSSLESICNSNKLAITP